MEYGDESLWKWLQYIGINDEPYLDFIKYIINEEGRKYTIFISCSEGFPLKRRWIVSCSLWKHLHNQMYGKLVP